LASAHGELGAALIFFGRPKEGLDFVQKSIRLNSREPNMVPRLLDIAMGVFYREYEAAVEAAKQVIRAYPDFPNNYRWLVAALGQLGPAEEEREALVRNSHSGVDVACGGRASA
jgi:adenylate cyclase